MSDLNDELLNYEIGDIEADGAELTGADEDELLLSDEEIDGKLSHGHDGDLCSDEERKTDKNVSAKRKLSDTRNVSRNNENSAVQEVRENQPDIVEQLNCVQSDEQTESKQIFDETISSSDHVDNESDIGEYQSQSQLEVSDRDTQSETTIEQSQETIESSSQKAPDDLEADDSDDGSERRYRNRKLCVEREQNQPDESNRSYSHGPQHYQRNRGGPNFNQNTRHLGPRGPHPYRNSGENYGPPNFMNQFGLMNRHPGNMMQPRPPHNRMPQMQQSHQPGQPPMNRLPPPQMMPQPMPPQGIRMQRPIFFPNAGPPPPNGPNFHPAPPFGNNQRMIRPMPQQMHQFPPFPPQNPNNMIAPRPIHPPQPPIHNQNINPTFGVRPIGPTPVIAPTLPARKVLLNPNFKGGVQAATNQLMMDTLKNSQMLSASREADLLRQQEAFINQNRMHIEKRRRSREFSPERERSYSPPIRRRAHSRERKPYGERPPFRGGKNRRANSREPYDNRRRRSGSREHDKNEEKTEEDEETRAYRLKIEKQKAMREKILRDKEMRRRRAAEGTKHKEDDKKVDDSPQKLTPIVVTEKKIISLKKKHETASNETNESVTTTSTATTAQRPLRVERHIPTATVLPETKRTHAESVTTAIVKPVMKKSISLKTENDDDIDEDALLADSPPHSSTASSVKGLRASAANAETSSTNANAGMFSNRRIVLRNNPNDEKLKSTADSSPTASDKRSGGIFDRLDKKIIGVNDASKRKIQRIVIKNTE